MTIAFEELEGSPTISVGPDGTTARRIFRVDWEDWPALVSQLIGTYVRVGSDFQFVAPLEFPGLPGVVVAQIDVAPLDPDNPDGDDVTSLTSGTNQYPAAGARVTASYESLPDSGQPSRADLPVVPLGTYLTYRADLGSEFLTVPGRGWHWDDPPDDPELPPDINPGLVIPSGIFRLLWDRVPEPNWDAIRQLRGKVNSADFVGASPGTVLFLGARVVRQFQFGIDVGFWHVEYLFSERAIELSGGGLAGWNFLYKDEAVDGEHWVQIKDEDGRTPYAEADLAPLFELPDA